MGTAAVSVASAPLPDGRCRCAEAAATTAVPIERSEVRSGARDGAERNLAARDDAKRELAERDGEQKGGEGRQGAARDAAEQARGGRGGTTKIRRPKFLYSKLER